MGNRKPLKRFPIDILTIIRLMEASIYKLIHR